MRKLHSVKHYAPIALSGLVASLIIPAISPSSANALDLSKVVVLSSARLTTDSSGGVVNAYLNTFTPNTTVRFKIELNNAEPMSLTNDGTKLALPTNGSFQFSFKTGPFLNAGSILKPVKEFKDDAGVTIIDIFLAPPDFPMISLSGDTKLIGKRDILSTPVVKQGSYAIDSVGTNIRYFVKSPNNIIGFRKLVDRPVVAGLGGQPQYAYLEQKLFDVTATSPGTWNLLDSNFQRIQQVYSVKTKYGVNYPEGHDIAVSPRGNLVVASAITRQVDSSWLKRSYKLPILDCDIAEINGGVALKEFSFWDWAVAHKSLSEPLLDAMPLFNDPQNPTSSPIDICHANSMEYSKLTGTYLVSLRSPSILLELSSDLKQVKSIIPADSSLQHFARFSSATEITALGNFTLGKTSKFLDFTLVGGKWILNEIPFPVHVSFCGNTQYLDASDIWLGGGCGAFAPGTLGAIFKNESGNLVQIGAVNMANLTYSYRADIPQI